MSMFVAGTGLASLGKEMEPLARAAKAPLSNLGAACAAALWYARSRLGLVATPKISWAPPALRPAADILERGVGQFGDACQRLLLSHGKRLQVGCGPGEAPAGGLWAGGSACRWAVGRGKREACSGDDAPSAPSHHRMNNFSSCVWPRPQST